MVTSMSSSDQLFFLFPYKSLLELLAEWRSVAKMALLAAGLSSDTFGVRDSLL